MQGERLETSVIEDNYQRKTGDLPLYDLQRSLLPGFIPYVIEKRRIREDQRRDDQRPRVQVDIPYGHPEHDNYTPPELPASDRGVTIIDFYSN